MPRPTRIPSPRLAALLGEDTTKNLINALGDTAARDLDSQLAELAQLGQLKAIQFHLQLRAGLERLEQQQLTARFEALDRKLDQVVNLLEQAVGDAERNWLESHGCVVQLNEVFRIVREDVQKLPHTVANATALAVGAAIVPATIPLPPAPIVLVARERGEAA